MTTKKRINALRLSATWTPGEGALALLADTLLDVGGVKPRVASARLRIEHAVAVDLADPDDVRRASARVAAILDHLREVGTLHDHTSIAGTAPVDVAEVLPAAIAGGAQKEAEE